MWKETHKQLVSSPCQVLLPLLTGQPLPPEKLEFATEELNVALKQFEEKFLQDKPFIAGSEISLADLVALVELMQVSINPSTAGYVSQAVGRPGQGVAAAPPPLQWQIFHGVKSCSFVTLTTIKFAREEHLL